MMKMEKVAGVVQTVIESAVTLCASGLAAVAYFDELYGFFVVNAVLAVLMQVVICFRARDREMPNDDITWL